MQHKSDIDWKFTVRLYDFAFLRQNSRGLSDFNKRVLHSSTCLLVRQIKMSDRPQNHKSRSEWPAHSWTPSIHVRLSISARKVYQTPLEKIIIADLRLRAKQVPHERNPCTITIVHTMHVHGAGKWDYLRVS